MTVVQTDFLKFIRPSGQKITRTGSTAKYAGPSVQEIFLFCTGNRKCNWNAGTITVNSELDSASSDIYFLNMQLFYGNSINHCIFIVETGCDASTRPFHVFIFENMAGQVFIVPITDSV